MSKEKEIPRTEFSRLTHNHLNKYIQLSNQKASILLTAQLAFLGLTGNFLKQTWVGADTVFHAIAIGAVGAALGASYFAARTVYPSTPKTTQGLILWSSIIDRGHDQYQDAIQNTDEKKLFEELVEENYRLAEVATGKYSNLRKSIILTGIMVSFSVADGAYFILS